MASDRLTDYRTLAVVSREPRARLQTSLFKDKTPSAYAVAESWIHNPSAFDLYTQDWMAMLVPAGYMDRATDVSATIKRSPAAQHFRSLTSALDRGATMPGRPPMRTDGSGWLLSLSAFARRLDRDERGLASMEFVLSAPIILLIVLFVKHGNLLMTKKIDTVTAVRNAAFAEANGMRCTSDMRQSFPTVFNLPIQAAEATGQDTINCSSERSDKASGEPRRTFIWDDLKREGADAAPTSRGT